MTAAVTAGPSAAQVSCVIPVYNEGRRVGAVLAAVMGHPLVREVIVVDDASTDDTAAVVGAVGGVRLIRLAENRGKTGALLAGIGAAVGPLLLLLDGDLVGLNPGHITALILPVLKGRADLSMSLRENAPRLWRAIGLDYISGERVFHKRLLENRLETLRTLPRFGFEVFLNGLCIAGRSRLAVVPWQGVQSPMKSAKYGLRKGMLGDLGMIADMCRTVPPLRLLRQIVAMRRLRVAPGSAAEDDLPS